MSDIDFDELDKAVSTLMSGVDTSKRNTVLDDPEDKVIALAPAPAEESPRSDAEVVQGQDTTVAEPTQATDTSSADISVETTETTPSEPVEEALAEAATPTSPSLAVKRRGQFMDMVHPSSDMKTSQRPTRREGVVIAPSPQAAPQETAQPASALPVEQAAEQPTAESAAESMPEPLVSPFLPDAKPEKRPLGSPVSESTVSVENTDDIDVEEQKPALPTPQVLPEELTGDILAIESNDLENSAAPAETAAGAIDTPEESAPEVIAEAAPAQPDPVAAAPSAGGSIPQQYAESPSTGDQTSGSIYDTANYHQPIEAAAPTKKSSPLKWILLAVGLLVIGGGAGVGYFLLTH